tara:strand:+ start:49963 stop:50307 length:345 start_codon:yes stop_codon:yes gene_type:complete
MRYFSIPLLFLTIGCGSMSDRTIHATAFVDHLNNMPSGKSSYLLWHNPNTGNKGDIKVTRSYLVKGIKCADYTSTVDIQDSWPLNGIGSLDRSTEHGTACQLPDGRWKIIERVL